MRPYQILENFYMDPPTKDGYGGRYSKDSNPDSTISKPPAQKEPPEHGGYREEVAFLKPSDAVKKGREEGSRDDTRTVACSDPATAFQYATEVDGAFNIETFEAVKNSPYQAQYTKIFGDKEISTNQPGEFETTAESVLHKIGNLLGEDFDDLESEVEYANRESEQARGIPSFEDVPFDSLSDKKEVNNALLYDNYIVVDIDILLDYIKRVKPCKEIQDIQPASEDNSVLSVTMALKYFFLFDCGGRKSILMEVCNGVYQYQAQKQEQGNNITYQLVANTLKKLKGYYTLAVTEDGKTLDSFSLREDKDTELSPGAILNERIGRLWSLSGNNVQEFCALSENDSNSAYDVIDKTNTGCSDKHSFVSDISIPTIDTNQMPLDNPSLLDLEAKRAFGDFGATDVENEENFLQKLKDNLVVQAKSYCRQFGLDMDNETAFGNQLRKHPANIAYLDYITRSRTNPKTNKTVSRTLNCHSLAEAALECEQEKSPSTIDNWYNEAYGIRVGELRVVDGNKSRNVNRKLSCFACDVATTFACTIDKEYSADTYKCCMDAFSTAQMEIYTQTLDNFYPDVNDKRRVPNELRIQTVFDPDDPNNRNGFRNVLQRKLKDGVLGVDDLYRVYSKYLLNYYDFVPFFLLVGLGYNIKDNRIDNIPSNVCSKPLLLVKYCKNNFFERQRTETLYTLTGDEIDGETKKASNIDHPGWVASVGGYGSPIGNVDYERQEQRGGKLGMGVTHKGNWDEVQSKDGKVSHHYRNKQSYSEWFQSLLYHIMNRLQPGMLRNAYYVALKSYNNIAGRDNKFEDKIKQHSFKQLGEILPEINKVWSEGRALYVESEETLDQENMEQGLEDYELARHEREQFGY